jgi:hypothetical protein
MYWVAWVVYRGAIQYLSHLLTRFSLPFTFTDFKRRSHILQDMCAVFEVLSLIKHGLTSGETCYDFPTCKIFRTIITANVVTLYGMWKLASTLLLFFLWVHIGEIHFVILVSYCIMDIIRQNLCPHCNMVLGAKMLQIIFTCECDNLLNFIMLQN